MNKFIVSMIGIAVALGIPLGFVVMATWWLEDRFGSAVAIMMWGGVAALAAFSGGAILSHRIGRATLESVADFMESNAQTEKNRAQLYREYARGEREAFSARAKVEVIDARRVDQLAQQRAALLSDSNSRASWSVGENAFVGGEDDFPIYE